MRFTVGMVDDHQLFLMSLKLMLDSFEHCKAGVMALNGKDLQEKMTDLDTLPDVFLIDVNMPVMDGIATANWLTEHYPAIKLVALSMNDSDKAIIGMIRAGCCAYLLKDTHPDELEKALNEVMAKGFYNADVSNINFRRLLISEKNDEAANVSEKERKFLQLACSDMTYKQIAVQMTLSEKTIDGYRETLFKKLKVQSRVGMVLEAVRKSLVKL